MRARISVVMAVYNGTRFLREAIESVLGQNFSDFEFIIVDDGSTDETPEILASYADPRIRVLRNHENLGLAASLNRGIERARGEYLARMDADDISRAQRFARQVGFLEQHPEVILLGTAYEEVDEQGRVVRYGDLPLANNELQTELLLRNRFCHGVVMMRRKALIRAGGYDEAFEQSQDYDLWLRLAELGEIANLPEYLYAWRRHPGSVGRLHESQQTGRAELAQRRAWRRRSCSLRFHDQATLLAWARAVLRAREVLPAVLLLAKAMIRNPFSASPLRLVLGRLVWFVCGRIRIGKAGAVRNEQLIGREIAAGRVRLRSHPSHLALLMIDKCNSKCVMCGGGYFAHTGSRRLSVEKCERVFDHLRPRLLTTVMFGGAGEPLLNPEFGEIVALTRKRCPSAYLQVITNGIALTEDVIEVLVEHEVHVLVSVNAATPETFCRIAQVDQFDRVVENLRASTSAGLKVTLSLIGMAGNISELPAIVRLAADVGAQGVLMNYCRFYPESFRFKEFDCPDNRLRERDSLFYHQIESDRHVVNAYRLGAELGVRVETEPLFAAPVSSAPCRYPWRVIFAGFDGEVYWCPGGEVLFGAPVESGRHDSGNLLTQDIQTIRNNSFMTRLRASLLGRAETLPECGCCGNLIERCGPRDSKSHLLDWSAVGDDQ